MLFKNLNQKLRLISWTSLFAIHYLNAHIRHCARFTVWRKGDRYNTIIPIRINTLSESPSQFWARASLENMANTFQVARTRYKTDWGLTQGRGLRIFLCVTWIWKGTTIPAFKRRALRSFMATSLYGLVLGIYRPLYGKGGLRDDHRIYL